MLAKVVSRMQEEILTRNPDQTSKEGHSGGQSTLEWVLCVCYRENCECWNGIIRQDGGGGECEYREKSFLTISICPNAVLGLLAGKSHQELTGSDGSESNVAAICEPNISTDSSLEMHQINPGYP
jgi:hypothetical protein